jgi:tetratricopeptide (TPR) repeat protein
MSGTQFSDEMLVDYLLGALSDEESRRIEERYFVDDELEDRLAEAERDLIDGYVRQELSDEQRRRIEEYFLATGARAKRLLFARALHAHQSTAEKTVEFEPKKPRLGWLSLPVKAGVFGAPALMRVAAILVASAAVAVVLWSNASNRRDLKEGLQALSMAYKDHRTSEARLSGLGYAPATVVRGNGTEDDERYRELADRLLVKAVGKHPDAQSHDALGRLYVAEGRLDEAINEFEAAVQSSPADPATVYSDMGAAQLEKSLAESTTDRGDAGSQNQELHAALESLNKALAIKEGLPEAVFNRALCYEWMKLPMLARGDWERYLRIDSDSGWALEAREHIRHIDESR